MVTWTHDHGGTPAEEWTADPRAARLPRLELDPEVTRLVVVSAHPDDESLGAAGLIHRAHHRGVEVVVVVATAGEASHPHSPTHTPDQLADVRRSELQTAVELLAPGAALHWLGLPDSRLPEHEAELLEALVGLVGDGRDTLLVAPWRQDGHRDHEAAGRVASTTAARTGARLLEFPIWLWRWGAPTDAPWDRLAALDLDGTEVAAKSQAQAAHRSQVQPLSEQSGDEVLLDDEMIRHFAGTQERYVLEDPEDSALDDLHAAEGDPWGVDSRWYETRKRSVLLASLPRQRYRHGLELGSSTGALAADLASRCDDLLVVDASAHAVAAARCRLVDASSVRVEQHTVPGEWPTTPDGGFDLIVLSEVGYFLSPRGVDALVERIRGALSPDGVLLLCHWLHPISGWPMDGPDVHAVLTRAGIRPVVARYEDRDFELLVLATPDELPDPRGDA